MNCKNRYSESEAREIYRHHVIRPDDGENPDLFDRKMRNVLIYRRKFGQAEYALVGRGQQFGTSAEVTREEVIHA